jgi:uncharacterized protein YfiM (DUF2279 family)
VAQDSLKLFQPSIELNKKRLTTVVVGESVGYVGVMIGLNEMWYKDYPRSSFHGFNDNAEWMQMDKFGHANTAYYVGLAGIEVLRWSGVKDKRAIWFGGTLGLMFLTSLEVYDGFSEEWGASTGDVVSNIAGTGLLIGQELAWKEQRIRMKFSAHGSDYAQHRPNVLGSTPSERMFKDYNGQTNWLSMNPSMFLPAESKFPKWLNIAVGYGAEGMLFGDDAAAADCELTASICALHDPYRQFYLSFDVDLSRLPVKSGFLRLLLKTVNFIKIPAPTLEFNRDGMKGYFFYF